MFGGAVSSRMTFNGCGSNFAVAVRLRIRWLTSPTGNSWWGNILDIGSGWWDVLSTMMFFRPRIATLLTKHIMELPAFYRNLASYRQPLLALPTSKLIKMLMLDRLDVYLVSFPAGLVQVRLCTCSGSMAITPNCATYTTVRTARPAYTTWTAFL